MRETTLLQYCPWFMAEYAVALGAVGRIDDGLAEIDAALRIATKTGYRWFVPEMLRIKGTLLAQRGSDDLTAMSLAEHLRGQHSEAEARAVLAPVHDRFTEGFSAAKLQRTKVLLSQLC